MLNATAQHDGYLDYPKQTVLSSVRDLSVNRERKGNTLDININLCPPAACAYMGTHMCVRMRAHTRDTRTYTQRLR